MKILLLDLLPAIVDHGWKAVVAAPGTGPLFQLANEAGAETASIPLQDYSNGRKTVADAARFIFDVPRLRNWIRRQEYDVISVGGARLLPGTALGARGQRLIFQAQHFIEDARSVEVARWAIHRAGATVIANSHYVAAQFKTGNVVYNGVPEIPFVRREFGKQWRIGLIGRIAPMKGQVDFLRAAAVLAPRLPGVRFVICGTSMFCPPSYVAEVNRLAPGLPVEFLGWRADIGAVLRDLDLLVVPSTSAEATTRVILEAFSAGVPVVAYAVGGIPELVREGENGFLVPECSPNALAMKILEIAKLNLDGVVRRARDDWERNFTVDRYRQQMTELIVSQVRDRLKIPCSRTRSAG